MGDDLPFAKTANPLDDPDYCQALIQKAGIDLNDPDFFADEDNFYDVPPYGLPASAEPAPDPGAGCESAFASGPLPGALEHFPHNSPSSHHSPPFTTNPVPPS